MACRLVLARGQASMWSVPADKMLAYVTIVCLGEMEHRIVGLPELKHLLRPESEQASDHDSANHAVRYDGDSVVGCLVKLM